MPYSWRVARWMLSISSSSSASSRISVYTAGSPQLFMAKDGGWIFKALLKVEVNRKADWADWVQSSGILHLRMKIRAEKEKPSMIVCSKTHIFKIFFPRVVRFFTLALRVDLAGQSEVRPAESEPVRPSSATPRGGGWLGSRNGSNTCQWQMTHGCVQMPHVQWMH